jgi:hypothetical protein
MAVTAQPTPNEPPSQAWAELVEAADRLDAMLHEFRDVVLVRAVAAGLAEGEALKESIDLLADDVRAERPPAESSLEERRQRSGA